jgi:probable addiction module antidote protein
VVIILLAGGTKHTLSRESLYKALSGERSPDFDTVLRVMAALGLRLHAEAAQG